MEARNVEFVDREGTVYLNVGPWTTLTIEGPIHREFSIADVKEYVDSGRLQDVDGGWRITGWRYAGTTDYFSLPLSLRPKEPKASDVSKDLFKNICQTLEHLSKKKQLDILEDLSDDIDDLAKLVASRDA